jgi:hypothetical protein
VPKPIPAVAPELLFKAVTKANEDHDTYGTADTAVSVVVALAGLCTREEVIAVSFRLTAFAELLHQGDGEEWTIKLKGKSHTLVNEALFRAAAPAPLFEAPTVGELAFNLDTFLPIALEEAEVEGNS